TKRQKVKVTERVTPSLSFYLLPSAFCWFIYYLSADVLPVPGFVKIRAEAETRGVLHQPVIGFRLGLQSAVVVSGADRLAANVKIKRAPGEVRAVDRQSGAPAVGRLGAKLGLILARAKRRDDFEIFFAFGKRAVARHQQAERLIGGGGGDHLLIG